LLSHCASLYLKSKSKASDSSIIYKVIQTVKRRKLTILQEYVELA
jgi:hypothetical protein